MSWGEGAANTTPRELSLREDRSPIGESNFLPENPFVVNLARHAEIDLDLGRIDIVPRPPEIQFQRLLGEHAARARGSPAL